MKLVSSLPQEEGNVHFVNIRADFAESIDANAVHGSDSVENATNEINFFFAFLRINFLLRVFTKEVSLIID